MHYMVAEDDITQWITDISNIDLCFGSSAYNIRDAVIHTDNTDI